MRLIEFSDSMFAKKQRARKTGRFAHEVALATEHPEQVVEVEWPDDLSVGQIQAQLQASARISGWRIRTRMNKDLQARGVFQIMRGTCWGSEPVHLPPIPENCIAAADRWAAEEDAKDLLNAQLQRAADDLALVEAALISSRQHELKQAVAGLALPSTEPETSTQL